MVADDRGGPVLDPASLSAARDGKCREYGGTSGQKMIWPTASRFAREQGPSHHHDRRDPARPGAWGHPDRRLARACLSERASQLTIDPADRQGMWKHTISRPPRVDPKEDLGAVPYRASSQT